MLLHAVSRFYEDGHNYTSMLPRRSYMHRQANTARASSRLEVLSSQDQKAVRWPGESNCRKKTQNNTISQISLFTPFHTDWGGDASFFYSTHTQLKALKLNIELMERKLWIFLTQSHNKKVLYWNLRIWNLYKAKSQHSDFLSAVQYIPGKSGTN